MSWGVCSELIRYWHLPLLQPKENQSVPMLKVMWALIFTGVRDIGSTVWCPIALFSSPQSNLESHFISLLWCKTWFPTEISFLVRRDRQNTGKAVRAEQSRAAVCTAWQQQCPTAGHSEGHTAPRDSQVPQGGTAQWSEPGSSLWLLPCKCFPVTTTALLNHGFVNTSTSFLFSSPVLPELVREPSVHFPQMSLFWQWTSLPVRLCLHNTPSYPASYLRSGMFFKLIQDLIHRVYRAYWMNAKLQDVFTSGKPC